MFEELLKFAEKSDEGRSKVIFNVFKWILQLIIASLCYRWIFSAYTILDITGKNVLEFFTKKEFAYATISILISIFTYSILKAIIYFFIAAKASKRERQIANKWSVPKSLTTYKMLRTIYTKAFPDKEVEGILKRIHLIKEDKVGFSEGLLYPFFEEFVILDEKKRNNVLGVFYDLIVICIYLCVFFIGYLHNLPSLFLSFFFIAFSIFLLYFTSIFLAVSNYLEEFELFLDILDRYILWKNKK